MGIFDRRPTEFELLMQHVESAKAADVPTAREFALRMYALTKAVPLGPADVERGAPAGTVALHLPPHAAAALAGAAPPPQEAARDRPRRVPRPGFVTPDEGPVERSIREARSWDRERQGLEDIPEPWEQDELEFEGANGAAVPPEPDHEKATQ